MMLFGRTLFGGALLPRQVTAEGSTVASAQAQVAESSLRRGAAGVNGTASVAQATAVRIRIPVAVATGGTALVSGAGQGAFAPGVSLSATAAVAGQSVAEYRPPASAIGTAVCQAAGFKRTRPRLPSVSLATAQMEGDGLVYVYADADAARARALPFATYWYVSLGEVVAAASLSGEGEITQKGFGAAAPTATASGEALAEFVGGGQECGPVAELDADPLQYIGGIEHHFGRGVALASVAMSAEPCIYTVKLAVGRATLQSAPSVRRAVSASALGHATAAGDAERVIPFEGAVFIASSAQATARANSRVRGAAVIQSAAITTAVNARFSASAHLQVNSTAQAQSLRLAIDVTPAPAGGSAEAKPAKGARIAGATGTAQGSSAAQGRAVSRLAAFGQTGGVSSPVGELSLVEKIPASGEATAAADLSGTNTVGVADQTLSTRVVAVAAGSRRLALEPSQRLIAVGGTARQLAA